MALLVLTNCAVFSRIHKNTRFSKKVAHTSHWIREVSALVRTLLFSKNLFWGESESKNRTSFPVDFQTSNLWFLFFCRNLQTTRKGNGSLGGPALWPCLAHATPSGTLSLLGTSSVLWDVWRPSWSLCPASPPPPTHRPYLSLRPTLGYIITMCL